MIMVKVKEKSILWDWKMLDGLTFTHSYSNNKHQYWQKNYDTKVRTQNNYYEDTDNMFLLQYTKLDTTRFFSLLFAFI